MHVFKGKWITNSLFYNIKPSDAYIDVYSMTEQPQPYLQNSHVLFRDKFMWNGERKVYLYFSADDYCKVYINGKFSVQGPATSYPFHYYYLRVDITRFLNKGENVIAFHTIYQGLVNRVWVSGDLRHGLIYDIVCGKEVLTYSCKKVKTIEHYGYTISHIVGYDTQFLENYDARSREYGFEKASFEDSYWENACERKFVDYKLYPQPTPILKNEIIKPQIFKKTGDKLFIDFGKEFVGNPVICVENGKSDDVLSIRCGEELNDDGTVRYKMRCNCDYSENITLKGGENHYEPYDYKSLRYVEVVGVNDDLKLSVYGNARHYPFVLKAKCCYNDKNSREIFELCINTLKFGLQDGYLDCPSREKGQYFGDGVWSAVTHIVLTGDTKLYKKFIADFFNSTKIVRGGTAQGPCSLVQKIAEYPLMAVISLKYYLKLTGDIKFVACKKDEFYDVLKFYFDAYARKDGLISVYDRWNVVDWPQSARDDYDFDLSQGKEIHGYHNVMNAYWIMALLSYERLYGKVDFLSVEDVKAAYKKVFYDEKTAKFRDRDGGEHCAISSQVFGLLTGVIKSDKAKKILLKMIEEKRLSKSNLFVTPIIFTWLKLNGKEELLHSLICDSGAWLNMINEGATTTFEAFSKSAKVNASLFHTMFAFPAIFMVKSNLFN
ncbi:MAG: family 78 glycoside hydrolase catalytic domain [Clostridia bacterium]|nr:family 78 glycoside hydrolase catalytic domain [Clostridia bacterium]